ncbi:MAG: type II toxin-antitoxin system RelE/ParE family toxin [Neisseriaceae bacterium]|nr:type II toxin-antitoxin system RelE/ParE family toxin [Neisseriaceae bacterium]
MVEDKQCWEIIMLDPFLEWLAKLNIDAVRRIYATIEILEEQGNQLGRPYADTLKGSKYPNLKELRVAFGRSVFRICFVFDPLRNAVILCGGDKQGVNEQRFYKRLIVQAETIYEQYLQQLGVDEK